MNRGRVGKRFEAGEFDVGQAHGIRTGRKNKVGFYTSLPAKNQILENKSDGLLSAPENQHGRVVRKLNITDLQPPNSSDAQTGI